MLAILLPPSLLSHHPFPFFLPLPSFLPHPFPPFSLILSLLSPSSLPSSLPHPFPPLSLIPSLLSPSSLPSSPLILSLLSPSSLPSSLSHPFPPLLSSFHSSFLPPSLLFPSSFHSSPLILSLLSPHLSTFLLSPSPSSTLFRFSSTTPSFCFLLFHLSLFYHSILPFHIKSSSIHLFFLSLKAPIFYFSFIFFPSSLHSFLMHASLLHYSMYRFISLNRPSPSMTEALCKEAMIGASNALLSHSLNAWIAG